MNAPHCCPVCEGRQNVSRFLYEEMTDSEAFHGTDEDKPDVVPCRTCGGTGVVWPPQPTGPLHISGDVVVDGNVVASGYREWMPPEEVLGLDLVAGETTVTASDTVAQAFSFDLATLRDQQPSLPVDAYMNIVTTHDGGIHVSGDAFAPPHPERKRVLDLLATLPEDMPLVVLTPRSGAEISGVRGYLRFLQEGSVAIRGAMAILSRMQDYARNHPDHPDHLPHPPDVDPRLAGLPVTEEDER